MIAFPASLSHMVPDWMWEGYDAATGRFRVGWRADHAEAMRALRALSMAWPTGTGVRLPSMTFEAPPAPPEWLAPMRRCADDLTHSGQARAAYYLRGLISQMLDEVPHEPV